MDAEAPVPDRKDQKRLEKWRKQAQKAARKADKAQAKAHKEAQRAQTAAARTRKADAATEDIVDQESGGPVDVAAPGTEASSKPSKSPKRLARLRKKASKTR